MPRALITGLTGQDGSYLAEHLLAAGYRVYGLVRRRANGGLGAAEGVGSQVAVLDGDLHDQASLLSAVEEARPDEVYHLASQSFVGRSWREPELCAEVTGLGALRMLEAVRRVAPRARFYQASSSEMFGEGSGPCRSTTPFRPRSPYGSSKAFAHALGVNYRESYGMHVCCGILFNHESPRRGPEFVTRKIAIAAARAKDGDPEPLRLGNIAARRDWGYAPEYVAAMQALLQRDEPSDIVVGTGVSHSVSDVCEAAYGALGLDWRAHVVHDAKLERPADIEAMVADPEEAFARIGWRAETGFDALIRKLVQAERQDAAGRPIESPSLGRY